MGQVLRRGPDGALDWVEKDEALPLPVRSAPGVLVQPNVAYVSSQVPYHHPCAPRVDEKGRAVFHSLHEVNEFIAKAQGDYGDYVHGWDGIGGYRRDG